MTVVKLFGLFALLFCSGCFASDEAASDSGQECDYQKESFKYLEPKDQGVLHGKWQHTIDSETGENVDRLVISYENGDVLVVEHKYCVIYNFHATYYSSSLIPQAAKVIERVKGIQSYNFYTNNLTVIPAEQLAGKLNNSSYTSDKPYRLNFDAADKKSENNVNYSISYDPLGSLGLMGSVVSLSVAVGGE